MRATYLFPQNDFDLRTCRSGRHDERFALLVRIYPPRSEDACVVTLADLVARHGDRLAVVSYGVEDAALPRPEIILQSLCRPLRGVRRPSLALNGLLDGE